MRRRAGRLRLGAARVWTDFHSCLTLLSIPLLLAADDPDMLVVLLTTFKFSRWDGSPAGAWITTHFALQSRVWALPCSSYMPHGRYMVSPSAGRVHVVLHQSAGPRDIYQAYIQVWIAYV